MAIERILRHRLIEGKAAPLEPSIRGFMETKFGASFDDVRIYTGPAAVSLCRGLQARALTLGRDIVFDEGQYAPESSAGRRLLAHELVHILQQRSANPPAQSCFVSVGDPLDDCEIEADRLAEQALGAGLRSTVTPDATGAIRRAIRVIADSAEMKFDRTDAEPSAHVNMRLGSAFFHLEKNAEPIKERLSTTSEADTSAINIEGQVDVELGPRDDIMKSDFHFIQLSKTHDANFRYAGRKSSQGSIAINLDFPPLTPPAFSGQFTLDSTDKFFGGANIMPFTNRRVPKIIKKPGGRVTVQTDMDDHPNTMMRLALRNKKTNFDNYLYQAMVLKEFLTAFVVHKEGDAPGRYQPLAYVLWNIFWKADFSWVENNPSAPTPEVIHDITKIDGRLFTCRLTMTVHSLYNFRASKSPPEKKLLDMITHPTTNPAHTSNAVNKAAIKALDAPGNVQPYDFWWDKAIPNFFK